VDSQRFPWHSEAHTDFIKPCFGQLEERCEVVVSFQDFGKQLLLG